MASVITGALASLLNAHAAVNAHAATAPVPAHAALLVTMGRAVYQQHCAVCHGERGEAARGWQQPDANGELPAPPHNAQGHTWKHSDAMLYRIIQEGWRDPFNKTQRLTMPPFKSQLSRADTLAVIAYLKTLWTPEQRRFQTEESHGHPFPAEAP
ncbi:MAG TPA: cytochrome c [Casimicrobiaceae bacterium]